MALTAKPGKRRLAFLRLAVLLLMTPPALAWNAAGHRLSAMIAWQRLDGETRSAVAAILRQHPDFSRWQARGKGADPDLTAFLEASTWPDDIRKDKRFYTAGSEQPTPTLAGFPDMERRLGWHYVDRPLPAGRRMPASAGVLDRQLAVLADTLSDPRASAVERSYALPWLIHLVGDAHQPLHTASRYGPDAADRQGDSGGNALKVFNPWQERYQTTNLHRYWDDLPGPPWLRGSKLDSAARSLTILYPAPGASTSPQQWIDESWQLAGIAAYPPSDDAVPTISAAFHANALDIARRRVTYAGYRLADQLQLLLKGASRRGDRRRHQEAAQR